MTRRELLPARQIIRWPSPPTLTRERMAAAIDAEGERQAKEWQSRLDLIGLYGSELTVDGFEERWDLDRDGKVTPAELPLPVWLEVRLGLRKP